MRGEKKVIEERRKGEVDRKRRKERLSEEKLQSDLGWRREGETLPVPSAGKFSLVQSGGAADCPVGRRPLLSAALPSQLTGGRELVTGRVV